ncbi:MAG: hypothetical protein IJA34_16460 [Lachnospiraceae bacterium]|nr:hypothetical protein [Lachnospiraceae bacterium]
MLIDEILTLDSIFEYEKEVKKKRNTEVVNISYWNTGKKYQDYMLKYINLSSNLDIFDYKYTYDIPKDIRNEIVKNMTGYTINNVMCILLSSSTCSITNMINYLKQNNIEKLCILTPSYFSVEHNCKITNLYYKKKQLDFVNGSYAIPYNYIIENDFDSVWITSPTYSTSVVFDDSQINIIKKLINKKILVIADETLALPGQELTKKIPINDYFYSIQSPHKPLFINSIKFSVILCPKKNDDFFEQWIDIIGGSLLHSNVMAISHFLSSNYSLCTERCIEWYNNNINCIESILNVIPDAYCNTNDIGAYKTIYIKESACNWHKFNNVKQLIDTQYVSYIPNKIVSSTGDIYNCFRVNMSLELEIIKNSLKKIFAYYD